MRCSGSVKKMPDLRTVTKRRFSDIVDSPRDSLRRKRFEAFVVSDRKGGEEKSLIRVDSTSSLRVDDTLSNGAGRTALPPRLASRDAEARGSTMES